MNGRFLGSMALAIAAGSNLADAWGRQVIGAPLPQLQDGRPGVRYLWAAGDVRRAHRERRGGLVVDLGSTLVAALSKNASSIWDVRDVGPALHLARSILRRGAADRAP